ncbi:hypothetical protein AB0D67_35495 [Streptosporangium sp. NPDC048047]|uniref:hypothetical protein n=1 Tax=Streptosporangium sp. NPDC048047 TaxID=3155748 RepID=UPI0034297903
MRLLMLKLVLAPALVVGSSLAGRRWGPRVTGTLVTFPIVAGPILLITYLEHGARFLTAAASASLLGLVSLALFAAVFAVLSRTRSWPAALLVGWSACLVADLPLSAFTLHPAAGLCLALAAIGVTVVTLPKAEGPAGGVTEVSPPWWDLPARAVATAVLVLILTSAAARLGPGLTGVLAPFPIATSVVAAFALAQGGPAATIATVRGVLHGLVGFAVFCFLVAVTAEQLGGIAFAIAAAGALGAQLVVERVRAVRRGRVPGGTPHGAVSSVMRREAGNDH